MLKESSSIGPTICPCVRHILNSFIVLSLCIHRLLLYGMCCSLDERCCNVDESTGITEAEEMMELATTIDSGNLVAWTIRGSSI